MPEDGVDDVMLKEEWDAFFALLAKITGGVRPNGRWWPDQYAEVVKQEATNRRQTRDVEKFIKMMSS